MTNEVELRQKALVVFRAAEAKTLTALHLSDFNPALEAVASDGRDPKARVSRDDAEWFRLYRAVLAKVESCKRAQDFGMPDGRWSDYNIQFEKFRGFYEGLEQVGAVSRVRWSIGGGADVTATDLRPIREHVFRQVLLRLREMSLQPSEEQTDVVPPSRDGPSAWRKVGGWIGEHVAQLAIAVIAALILVWIGVQ